MPVDPVGKVYLCIGCGSPANVDGDTACDCHSDILYKRNTFKGWLTKPRYIDRHITDLRLQIKQAQAQRRRTILTIRKGLIP